MKSSALAMPEAVPSRAEKEMPLVAPEIHLHSGFRLNTILRRTAGLGSATVLSRILCAVRSLINARFLGPQLYGFWGSVSFLVSFGFHLHGGVQDMMLKEIPAHRSRGHEVLARETAQQSFSFFAGMLCLAGAVIAITAFCLPAGTPSYIRWGWLVAAITLPLEAIYFFEQNVARSEERFEVLHRTLLIASSVSLLLTFWLVIQYGITGLFIVAVLTPLMGVIYLRRHATFSWRLRWNPRKIAGMLKAGWPILTMTLVFESLWWIDRFLVLGIAGITGFGYYALGLMVLQICFLVPQVLASVIEPRLYFDFNQSGDLSAVRDHLWFPLKLLSFVMPAGLILADLVLPPLISWLFPAYVPGIPAMRLLLWGSLFMGWTMNVRSFIIAAGKQREVLKFYGIAAAINLAVSYFLCRLGWGLVGIAAGTVIAYAACSFMLLHFAFRELHEPWPVFTGKILQLLAPAGLALSFSFLFPKLMLAFFGGQPEMLFRTFGAAAVLGCGFALLFWLLPAIRKEGALVLQEGGPK